MDKIKAMEDYAKAHDVPIMETQGIQFLCSFIQEHNVKNILEIGSAIGYSSIRMAMVDESIRVTTIERDDDRYFEAVKNIKEMGLQDRITITHGDALETSIEGFYDMIFIDAAKAQYIRFFERYEQNLAPSGYMISDNLQFHGFVDHPELIQSRNLRQLIRKIKNYIDYLQERDDFDTQFYEIGDGVAISKRKSS